MSQRDWLHCVAIGGCLVLWAAASHAQNDAEQQPQTAPPAQAEKKTEPPPVPVTISGPVRIEREKEVEPDWNKLKCSEAKSHDEADLCEQRRMSNAAEESVTLNKWQIAVAIIGFALVVWNLYYTRKATNAAVAAAVTAEKAMFEIEAPYLYPVIRTNSLREDLVVRFPHPNSPFKPVTPTVSITIKNYGRAPAIFEEIAVSASHWRKIPDDPRADVRVDCGMPTMIEAGQEIIAPFTIEFEAPMNRADIRSIVEQFSHIYVYGVILYSGVQNAGYVQRFCLMYHYPTKSFVPAGTEYNNRTRQPERARPAPKPWWHFPK